MSCVSHTVTPITLICIHAHVHTCIYTGETYACGLGDIYTFGPTFRAENSQTSKHLAEFHMVCMGVRIRLSLGHYIVYIHTNSIHNIMYTLFIMACIFYTVYMSIHTYTYMYI